MDPKPCGLITVIPPSLQAEWAARFDALVNNFRPAALILRGQFAEVTAQIISAARPIALAVLLLDAVEEAQRAGAGGVYFSAPGADIALARASLGSASVLGAASGLSRHAAMESAEAGADFVAFDAREPTNVDKALQLSAWWDEITGVPSALDFGTVWPSASALPNIQADFLILEETERAAESLTFATEFGLQSQT